MELFYDIPVGGWGYSSGVEHLTADQEVPGSNPGAPCALLSFFFFNPSRSYTSYLYRGPPSYAFSLMKSKFLTSRKVFSSSCDISHVLCFRLLSHTDFLEG